MIAAGEKQGAKILLDGRNSRIPKGEAGNFVKPTVLDAVPAVSEVGDHFNNIAVLSLAVEETHSGAIIAGLMLSRAIPAVLVGPVAGVLLDRFDRKRIMIASDLLRGFIALVFIPAIGLHQVWLLYVLS